MALFGVQGKRNKIHPNPQSSECGHQKKIGSLMQENGMGELMRDTQPSVRFRAISALYAIES